MRSARRTPAPEPRRRTTPPRKRPDVEEQLQLFEQRLPGENAEQLRGIAARVQELRAVHPPRDMVELNTPTDTPEPLQASAAEAQTAEVEEQHVKGSEALEDFIESARSPQDYFYLDRTLPVEELEERRQVLDELYQLYLNASADERMYMEEAINRLFGIARISDKAAAYLDYIDGLASTGKSQGAENRNLMFVDHTQKSQVIKISLERHDFDFTSILKLMRDMHALALHMNSDHELPDGTPVHIRTMMHDMMVYMDGDSNYKRMMRQDFAPGMPIGQVTEEMRQDPQYQQAWKLFLGQVDTMKEPHGVFLDVSDSSKSTPARGNVANTENVFVYQLPEGGYLFSIVDLDVFDVRGTGVHKFDPLEYEFHSEAAPSLRKKARKVRLTNWSRDTLVSRWQDNYSQKEQE